MTNSKELLSTIQQKGKEIQRLAEQERMESRIRAAENLKILDNAGVKDLFQKNIDKKEVSSLVDQWISYGNKNRYIKLSFTSKDVPPGTTEFCRIDVLSDGKIGYLDFNITDDGKTHCYIEDNKLFSLTKQGSSLHLNFEYSGSDLLTVARKKKFHIEEPKEIEITNIAEYVASKILEPDVCHG